MNILTPKKCFYCLFLVIPDDMDDGWIYLEDVSSERIEMAHIECVEVYDDLKIREPVDWLFP